MGAHVKVAGMQGKGLDGTEDNREPNTHLLYFVPTVKLPLILGELHRKESTSHEICKTL